MAGETGIVPELACGHALDVLGLLDEDEINVGDILHRDGTRGASADGA